MPAPPWRRRVQIRGTRLPTLAYHRTRLPLALVVLLMQATPRGATLSVPADGDLEAVLELAQPGDTIEQPRTGFHVFSVHSIELLVLMRSSGPSPLESVDAYSRSRDGDQTRPAL